MAYGPSASSSYTPSLPNPQFPTHNAPRVWLLTSGDSPIGVSLSRLILEHGDYLVSGIDQDAFENDDQRSEPFKEFLSEIGRQSPPSHPSGTLSQRPPPPPKVASNAVSDDGMSGSTTVVGKGSKSRSDSKVKAVEGGNRSNDINNNTATAGASTSSGNVTSIKDRLKVVALDIRNVASCQSALAVAIRTFSKVDILLVCTSQAVVGAAEEFAPPTSPHVPDTVFASRDDSVGTTATAMSTSQGKGRLPAHGSGVRSGSGNVGIKDSPASSSIPRASPSSHNSLSLVRSQFETNFFGPMNIMRAVIPSMRAKSNGHIIVLSSVTGHIGTPGLGVYCSSTWALEGLCDSLAYEIAPFNVKVTIVQASIEIGILTNKVTAAPAMAEYSYNPDPHIQTVKCEEGDVETDMNAEGDGGDDDMDVDSGSAIKSGAGTGGTRTGSRGGTGHVAPLFRNILDGLLNQLPLVRAQHANVNPTSEEEIHGSVPAPQPPSSSTSTSFSSTSSSASSSSLSKKQQQQQQRWRQKQQRQRQRQQRQQSGPSLLSSSSSSAVSIYPPLGRQHTRLLVAETVHAITAIAGHDNPPARHIVGVEGVASVKEKLKTVSEELEEFVAASGSVDYSRNGGVSSTSVIPSSS